MTDKMETLEKEFFERFGANKIWVEPSKENVETILNIWEFMQRAYAAGRKEGLKEAAEVARKWQITESVFEHTRTRAGITSTSVDQIIEPIKNNIATAIENL